MGWRELGTPKPRAQAVRYEVPPWPSGTRLPLTESVRRYPSIDRVMRTRRTRYDFGELDLQDLGDLLALSVRAQRTMQSDLGFALSQRPTPSAGAIHPIHVLLHRVSEPTWERYDPYGHALVSLATSVSPGDVRERLCDFVALCDATVLVFAADPQQTGAKYLNPDSLIWRDAGALLAAMAYSAEALSLSFAPLGATGHEWAARFVPSRRLVGVGVALVGARAA